MQQKVLPLRFCVKCETLSAMAPRTLDELMEDLTAKQRALIKKVAAARNALDAAMEHYGKTIDDAVQGDVSYRMIERETGISYPSLFRTRKRWHDRRAG